MKVRRGIGRMGLSTVASCLVMKLVDWPAAGSSVLPLSPRILIHCVSLESSGYLRKLSKQTDEARVDATLNSLVLQGVGSGSR